MVALPKKPRRLLVLGLLVGAVAVPAALVAQDMLTMDDEEQKDWLTSFVQDRLSTPERQIRLSNIDGILGSDVSIRTITISDQEGVWLRVNNASLNWNQAALFTGRLEVRSLRADSIEYLRNAVPAAGAVDLPPPEAGSFQIPEFPVAIQLGELSVPSVTFGESVFGLGSEISLAGALTLEDGNLTTGLDIVRLDGPGGSLNLDVAYTRADNRIDLDLGLNEPANGVIANLLNIEGRPAMQLTLAGEGPVTDLVAEMQVLADGRTALSGTATVAQGADGIAINADLGGPLSTLMAEPYRPFFGAETRLSARALLREEGGLDISGLTLSGGQLALSATAETTADNFLSRLDLDASIADPTGSSVILPVPGGATRVGTARLSVDFGVAGSEDWNAVLGVDRFETDGIAVDTLGLTLGGVARDLEDPAKRMVTFNGDGTLAGVTGDEGIEAAFGDSVGLGLAGLWNAGEPIQLAQLRIVGEALTADLTGTIDGTDFDGTVQLETANIAPFSALAGRQLSGGMTLVANGRIQPLSGGFDLDFDGTGRDLRVDDPVADALLEGEVRLDGRLARTEAGIVADDFSIANAQVQFTADGVYASDTANFAIGLDLSDLALISPQASGALSVRGTATSTTAEEPLVLALTGRVPSGQLDRYALRDAQIGLTASLFSGVVDGDVSGSAMLDGHRASLASRFRADNDVQSLSGMSFEVAGTRLTGAVNRSVETGLFDGRLDIAATDISLAAALLLADASGALNAAVTLTPEGDTQSAGITANAANLRFNDIAVGQAEITATLGDLFGVPAANGTATARAVSAGGVTVNLLNASASQSGETTSFTATAALATGTGVDVRGALSPIDGGYRLALNHANLVQGRLSARLANPTSVVVRDESIALDAVRFLVGSGSITATGTAGTALDMVVDIADLPLNIANAVVPSLGLSGTVNGRATVTGSASDPRVRFDARGSGISAAAVAPYGIAPLSFSANGSFAANAVALDSLTANGSGGLAISGSGRVPLSGPGLAVSLTGSAPLALANQFVADRGGQFSGTANLDARVSGSLTSPQFAGTVATSGAGYVDPELNLRLTNINGRVALSETRATIETLSANLATGGSVSASGTVGLTGALPANVNLNIASARYADADLFVATLSGGLTLTGNILGTPLLAGNVLVEEAFITVPESLGGGAAFIDVRHRATPAPVRATLERAKVFSNGVPAPRTRPPGLLLDINVNAPNQIFIRGRGLDAEVGGSVRLTGPVNAIQPVGAFTLTRGRMSIIGQRITFDTGTVTLVGDLDPQIFFQARTGDDDLTVFVTVAGRVSDPDITFTSAPQLPQDEVLSRLLFRRSMGELSPLQLAQLATAAAELVGGGGGGGLLDGLRGAAGLADLDVVTDAAGNVGVQAGTYLQDNVYLGVTAGANGQSRVSINLDVTDELTVRGAAGQDGNSSIGVFYEQDY